jgi:hypothetical protein
MDITRPTPSTMKSFPKPSLQQNSREIDFAENIARQAIADFDPDSLPKILESIREAFSRYCEEKREYYLNLSNDFQTVLARMDIEVVTVKESDETE